MQAIQFSTGVFVRSVIRLWRQKRNIILLALCTSQYNNVADVHSLVVQLTLKVLVTTIDAQWEGMGDVGSARYEPALLPPCPTIRV